MKPWKHEEVTPHNALRFINHLNKLSKYLEELSQQVLPEPRKPGRPKKKVEETKQEDGQ